MITWYDILLRLGVALACCGAVGVQRYLAGKAAGVRTHILVGMGAALYTLVSAYAFTRGGGSPDRIAAQVVTGIGFIGGGAILKEGSSIKGLTTAAGLWAVASLGMAAGAGLYTICLLGTAIILVTLVVLRRLEYRLPRTTVNSWSIQVMVADGVSMSAIRDAIQSICKAVVLDRMVSAETTELVFSAELPHHADIDALTRDLRRAGARSVSWQAHETGNAERGV